MNMADVSGYSRYSIETAIESEADEEVNTNGLTDGEITNDSRVRAKRKGHTDDNQHQEMIRVPVRRAVRGVKGWPRSKMTGRVPLHPMIYEQQSYNSSLPMWKDGESHPAIHRGYLTYRDDDGEREGVEEGEMIWRDVGYFNTEDRRRLHGDYNQYIEMEDDSVYSSPDDNTRSHRSARRRMSFSPVKYSLTAHIMSMTFVFVILLLTFLLLQYFDIWGQLKDMIWSTYYTLYELYVSLASGSYSFTCQVGGSPFQMIECEFKQSFNRLLLSSVTQCVQFVNAAMKVDNVPHAIALLAGAYSALSAFVWSIKWPVMQVLRGSLGLLTGAYDASIRVCHNSGF